MSLYSNMSLRADLRLGDDPRQCMAMAMGVLREKAEGLKTAIASANGGPILRAIAAVERAIETTRQIIDNGGLTIEESLQSSKEARLVYEEAMALTDDLAEAKEAQEHEDAEAKEAKESLAGAAKEFKDCAAAAAKESKDRTAAAAKAEDNRQELLEGPDVASQL